MIRACCHFSYCDSSATQTLGRRSQAAPCWPPYRFVICPVLQCGGGDERAARRRPAKAGTILSQKPAFYAAHRLAKAGMILSQNPAFYAAQRPAKAGTIRSQKPAFYAAQRLAKAGMILSQNPAFYRICAERLVLPASVSQNPAFYATQRPAKAGTIRSQKPACYAAQRLAKAGMIGFLLPHARQACPRCTGMCQRQVPRVPAQGESRR